MDRVLERGRLLTLDGPSTRTRHLGLDDPTASGVISGASHGLIALRAMLGIGTLKQTWATSAEAVCGVLRPLGRCCRGLLHCSAFQCHYAPFRLPSAIFAAA